MTALGLVLVFAAVILVLAAVRGEDIRYVIRDAVTGRRTVR